MALDLNSIKTEFATILTAANTTTAAYDLSTNMRTSPARPVQGIFKVNPNYISYQASTLPFVTIFNEQKMIDLDTIAGDQTRGKRMTEMRFTVVGAVWQNQVSNVLEDKADEQISYLMENVEEVIRRNYRLSNTVLWSKPERVDYYTTMEEGAYLRWGVMTLLCKIHY